MRIIRRFKVLPSAPLSLHDRTTLMVEASGCVAWLFPRGTLSPFLEANPGVLLSLLGTQVII